MRHSARRPYVLQNLCLLWLLKQLLRERLEFLILSHVHHGKLSHVRIFCGRGKPCVTLKSCIEVMPYNYVISDNEECFLWI